jgi:hypothetical protein
MGEKELNCYHEIKKKVGINDRIENEINMCME